MPGQKKWCEYCHINLPYDKKAIQEHQTTNRHIMNQKKCIKYERIKIQQQEKAAKAAAQQNCLLSTANIPKAKKGSELEKQVAQYRNSVMMNGKMAIHQLIAQKTSGVYGAPIQYPQKQELVLAENYQDSDKGSDEDESFQMWKIDICEETGKPCFINRITKAKVYEPPKGYVLSEQQKEEWEETIKICEQMPDPNLDQAGQVGMWEQVPEQQDYFKLNKAPSQSDGEQKDKNDHDSGEQAKIKASEYLNNRQKVNNREGGVQVKKQLQVEQKNWMQDLHQKVYNNQVNESEVISTILTHTLQDCKNVKEKNEALKKLIRNDFEIKATLARHDEQLALQQMNEVKKEEGSKKISFKARKKVKKCDITDEKDMV